MQFSEIELITIYFENHREHTNTSVGKMKIFFYVKAGGIYSKQYF